MEHVSVTTELEETLPAGRRPWWLLEAAIVAGGIVGALARAGLAAALPWHGHGWPWPTFIVNVVGTLLLGYLATRLHARVRDAHVWRALLGTGFCGTLTTFSTFELEVMKLAKAGELSLAAAYLASTLAAGLVGVFVARRAGAR